MTEKSSPTQKLLHLIEEEYSGECYRTSEGRTAVSLDLPTLTGSRQVNLDSREGMIQIFSKLYAGKHGVNITRGQVLDAIAVLFGAAMMDTTTRTLHHRVAWEADNRTIILDMGDGDSVEIRRSGWRRREKSKIRFVYAPWQVSLPSPHRWDAEALGEAENDSEGALKNHPGLERLKRLFAGRDDVDSLETDKSLTMLLGWMVGAMMPFPFCPILMIHSPGRSGKSSTCNILKRILDPSRPEGIMSPHGSRIYEALAVWANHHRLIAIDDVQTVPVGMGSALSSLADGQFAFATRKQYSDLDAVVVNGARPVVLTSRMDPSILPPTCLEKTVFVEMNLQVKSDPKPDPHGYILGLLCELLVSGLGNGMHEYAEEGGIDAWSKRVSLCLRGLGEDWAEMFEICVSESKEAAEAYTFQRDDVLHYIHNSPAFSNWQGTATDLYITLMKIAHEWQIKSSEWPKSGRSLTHLIRTAQPQLQARGVIVEFSRSKHTRQISIRNSGRKA